MASKDASDELLMSRSLVAEQNRKKQKSGGFQSMGLSPAVFKGIQRKGYRVPTPIQRKTVPHILAGRDVVAMARTGSGKTAAFLIPLLERLRVHQCGGARALILSPTRELAMQTLDFCRAIGKFTDISVALVLGGDSMDNQFTALHSNPDVIVASPGRLLHLLTEMEAKLSRVQMLVLDECDRLFELGFQEQISLLLSKLPAQRQTLLFSATLPQRVADFARAGLTDPLLIRLDLDTKLSQQLRLSFLACRDEDKLPVLMHLLHNALAGQQLTLVFVATKHHVEWLYMLLSTDAALSVTYLYSSMDPLARRLHAAEFRSGERKVLITTDLAARGLDLPELNHVINFHFPPKEKLFVHRVGRVARAGRSGNAVSLVAADEMPYLYDLEMFLGARKLRFLLASSGSDAQSDSNDCIGSVPSAVIEDFGDWCRNAAEVSADIRSQYACAVKAQRQYLRSRPPASREAVKRHKAALRAGFDLRPHPLFAAAVTSADTVLSAIKSYKAKATIFETKHAAATVVNVMQQFRKKNAAIIEKVQSQKLNHDKRSSWIEHAMQKDNSHDGQQQLDDDDHGSHQHSSSSIASHKAGFIAYAPDAASAATERGLALDLQASSMDMLGDEVDSMRKRQQWDRKRKKFVSADAADAGKQPGGKQRRVMVRTESGHMVPASYKTDRYAKWRRKNPQFSAEAAGDAAGDGNGPGAGAGDADVGGYYGADHDFVSGGSGGGGGGRGKQRRGVTVLGKQRRRCGPSPAAAAAAQQQPGRRTVEQIVKMRRTKAASAERMSRKKNNGNNRKAKGGGGGRRKR